MKRIYTFTLDSDEYPSSSIKLDDDLRLIAYMLYNEIFNYYGETDIPLDINDKIIYNNLNEHCLSYKYRFTSDIYDDGYTYYEPFIVGKNTFGFTIVDESFDEEKIRELFQYVLNLLKLNYTVTISSTVYEAKDINDERYREEAIRSIYNRFGCKCTIKTGFMGMIMRYNSTKRRSRSNRRKCYGYY